MDIWKSDFKKTNINKPVSGYYTEKMVLLNEELYLLKGANYHCYYNNEAYLINLIQAIIGKENSSICYLTIGDDNKYKIISKIIPNTKNILELYKINNNFDFLNIKTENFISSIIISIILNNIDPNCTNILFSTNNKFYLIDPLLISNNNQFSIDADKIYKKIELSYNNFLNNLDKENLKAELTELFINYFTVCNGEFLHKVIEYLIKRNENKSDTKLQNTITNLSAVYECNKEFIKNNTISLIINNLTTEKILNEMDKIRKFDENIIKEIGNYFEAKFEDFGEQGIKKNYYVEVIFKLNKLKKLKIFCLADILNSPIINKNCDQ